MKITIIGNIMGTSGYSSHTRGLANGLMKYCDVKILTTLFPDWEKKVNDDELKSILKQDTSDINIIIDVPYNWPPYLRKKYNIGFLVWEGDKIPKSWIENIKDDRITQVWVPSSYVYSAIQNSLEDDQYIIQQLMNKVKIVPHGYDPNIFKPINTTDSGIFIFLCNKGFRNELDRGGIQHAIKAFLQEFKKEEAKLLLKINPAYGINPELINNEVAKYCLETELNKKNTELPEILAIFDELTPEEMNSLYNQSDVLISPTGGEAFNLPCLESMSCGKPVITTNFGGQIDYVTNENGWLINYDLKEVKHDLFYEGIKWAQPNIEHLRKLMREAKTQHIYKQEKALETAKEWTWDNSAKKAIEHLNKIGL